MVERLSTYIFIAVLVSFVIGIIIWTHSLTNLTSGDYLALDVGQGFLIALTTAIVFYWVQTGRHDKLKKLGLKDGVYADVRIIKAGGEIFAASMNGYNFPEMIKNVIDGLTGANKSLKSEVKDMVKGYLKVQIKNELIKEVNSSGGTEMKDTIQKLIKEVLKEELSDEQKKDETKSKN